MEVVTNDIIEYQARRIGNLIRKNNRDLAEKLLTEQTKMMTPAQRLYFYGVLKGFSQNVVCENEN